jgi:hypothetical protein
MRAIESEVLWSELRLVSTSNDGDIIDADDVGSRLLWADSMRKVLARMASSDYWQQLMQMRPAFEGCAVSCHHDSGLPRSN